MSRPTDPSPDPFSLAGETAIVTGASRGIGRAISVALAAAGADVIGVSATMSPDGGECGAAVRSRGRSFEGHAVNFADRHAVADLGETLAERGASILVNNAGTIARAPALEHPLDVWDRVLEVDLTAHFALTRAIAGPMLDRRHGRIIFTASLLSYQGGLFVPSYTAAKHGIAGLTKALANEWTGRGVTVNAIAPGYISTDNTAALRADSDRNREITARIPAGRWGRPDDIGGAAVFLASAAACYVSGVVLPVDGGWLGR
jgi:2-deoxy-D-gluconate 3-dehydrogenase